MSTQPFEKLLKSKYAASVDSNFLAQTLNEIRAKLDTEQWDAIVWEYEYYGYGDSGSLEDVRCYGIKDTKKTSGSPGMKDWQVLERIAESVSDTLHPGFGDGPGGGGTITIGFKSDGEVYIEDDWFYYIESTEECSVGLLDL